LSLARLLLPAVRWSPEHGFHREWDEIDRALELGVGGFILFGGEAGAVRDLTDEMRRRAPHPLLIASDLERGAGQQFRGGTPLPPAAALAALGELEVMRRAGEVTAREARALGVNWVFAPVADVDLEPDNPITGTRAFGSDPVLVAQQVAEWVRGCGDGGALSCAKHFPGHGRTRGDSHVERPTVDADRDSLEADLAPFRAAIDAGVDSVMTAHVAYPALDPSGAPATLSAPMLNALLRAEMGFEGLVVSDALVMDGLVAGTTEQSAAVAALAAGCDVLLYPKDAAAVVAALEAGLRQGTLSRARADDAMQRFETAVRRVADSPSAREWGREEDRRWALDTAIRAIRICRGDPRLPVGPVRLVEIDDDLGGPHAPVSRSTLPAALRQAGLELREDGAPLVALYADILSWKGRPGISPAARERVSAVTEADPEVTVLLFSHPRLADQIPSAGNLLCTWGGESLMQEAAVSWLTGTTGALPTAAWGLDR
jgi:beta-glucosidase-like glycosyl hydrolase